MTTGTLSAGICFATQAAAARTECSMMARQGNQGMTCTGMTGTLPSETVGGAVTPTFTQRWQTAGSTSTTTVQLATPLQACELEDYWPWPLSITDGGLIAGAVALVWMTAYAARAVRRTTD